ncbi:uncharacterized protein N7511_007906 [Penicillium nucicola]|uniref:uncharacterized protein n=1 Tax=Penicillium nucicola TaxID=1850975 RepID=UPI00254590AD|nr:uncharacterized protein N7511_007906 [Penicillium nucicola]KAJ5753753.1 hypothetical protein N7511_007906 [Penicillium nucicola]
MLHPYPANPTPYFLPKPTSNTSKPLKASTSTSTTSTITATLTIYLLTTCLILPIFRRYHARYSQYLPLHNISAHTLSLRDRIADALMRFFLRSRGAHAHMGDHEDDNISIDDEEGEILVRMEMDAARREVLERRGGNGGSEGETESGVGGWVYG